MAINDKKPQPINLQEILRRQELLKGKPTTKVYAIPVKKKKQNSIIPDLPGK
jgi:hypothetical protein